MIDVFAALSLVSAAARTENAPQLFADAEKLYGIYQTAKSGGLNLEELAKNGELKTVIQAVARLSATANALAEDPSQLHNVANLLNSL